MLMMIVRPDGLLTRDSLPRLSLRGRRAMPERAPCLAIEGLTKRFGGFYALNELRMEVAHGHIHALIGPNGAGKTTFFNLVTGVLAADAGRITFEGAAGRRRAPVAPHAARASRARSRTSACSRT